MGATEKLKIGFNRLSLLVIYLLCFAFALYILVFFFIQPVSNWQSVSNFAQYAYGATFICIHWVGGFLLLTSGPSQLIQKIRNKYPKFHRYNGRVYIFGCILASIGGLLYIFSVGTVGGYQMDIAFTLYGIVLFINSIMAITRARQKNFKSHREWALRTFWVGIGSAIYRIYVSPLFLEQLGIQGPPYIQTQNEFVEWLNVAGWLMYVPNIILIEIYLYFTRIPAPSNNQPSIEMKDNNVNKLEPENNVTIVN